MTVFCIQLQPERATGIDFDAVTKRAAAFADTSSFVVDFWTDIGDDYINLMFATEMRKLFWHAFLAEFLGLDPHGQAIRNCCLAYCEGSRGWDDYLVLHHYDPTEQLDRLT
ncbi:MAG: hypothetical protein B7Z40_01635 [Bosea sp. 12-68-7]|nr:MAG: hypothetical protein B7Z40_01635 [Bosea sp. 12-68-7]